MQSGIDFRDAGHLIVPMLVNPDRRGAREKFFVETAFHVNACIFGDRPA